MLLAIKARRALARWRAGGWRSVAHLLSANGYVPYWLWYLCELELLRLETLNPAATARVPQDCACRPATAADIPLLAALAGGASTSAVCEEFAGYLADGHQCFLVAHAGRVVGYDWVFSSCYPLVLEHDPARTLTIDLQPDTVFFAVGFILPQYRLKGLYPFLINYILCHRGPGTRYYTAVHTANEHSLRTHRRLGFVPVATAVCSRLLGGGYRWTIRKSGGARRQGAVVAVAELA